MIVNEMKKKLSLGPLVSMGLEAVFFLFYNIFIQDLITNSSFWLNDLCA